MLKIKLRVSYWLKIWEIIFHVSKFEVTGTTPVKITGRRTCHFVLLIHTYVTLIKYIRKLR